MSLATLRSEYSAVRNDEGIAAACEKLNMSGLRTTQSPGTVAYVAKLP